MIREIFAQFQHVKMHDGHNAWHSVQLYTQSCLSVLLAGITMLHVDMAVRIATGLAALVVGVFTAYKIYLDIKIKQRQLRGHIKPNTDE